MVTDLANVQVITIGVQLWVVEVEDGGIDNMVGRYCLAAILRLDNISLCAV